MSREEIYTTSPEERIRRGQLVDRIDNIRARWKRLDRQYGEILQRSEHIRSGEAVEMREAVRALMMALNRSLAATMESSQKTSDLDGTLYFDVFLALGRKAPRKKNDQVNRRKLVEDQKNMLALWERLVDVNGQAVITQAKIAQLADPKETPSVSLRAIALMQTVLEALDQWFQNSGEI